MVFELEVLEGADVGHLFTISGDEVVIGRGSPKDVQPGQILINDTTVSSRQARIRRQGEGLEIEHLPEATNPTIVNGRAIDSSRLDPGDRIQIGRVTIKVGVRDGYTLAGEEQLPADATRTQFYSAGGDQPTLPQQVGAGSGEPGLRLRVVRGGAEVFPLASDRVLIGRGHDCDVTIPDIEVSRQHAALIREEGELWLKHLSTINMTRVNGSKVIDRQRVQEGDLIQLSPAVSLRLESADAPLPGGPGGDAPTRAQALPGGEDSGAGPSLATMLEDGLIGEQSLERYKVTGSFLDVDVVGSYEMKRKSGDAQKIVVSFHRWRSWTQLLVEEFGGELLCSNGDELMCFFERPMAAVTAGSEMLRRLDRFNEEKNLLETPFRLRIGIHSGSSLVDRRKGVAFSQVLDTAGHLQKAADPDGLLVSRESLDLLPDDAHFEPGPTLEHEGIGTFKLCEPIDPEAWRAAE